MTQKRRQTMTGPGRPPHGVELRVTNAAGKQFNQHLIGPGAGELDFVHDQRLVGFHEDRRSAFCAHIIPSLASLWVRRAHRFVRLCALCIIMLESYRGSRKCSGDL
jgi:hypothetical protein